MHKTILTSLIGALLSVTASVAEEDTGKSEWDGNIDSTLKEINTTLANDIFNHGFNAAKAGKDQEAEEAFLRVIELNPDDHRARLELGLLYYMQGELKQARAQIEKVLQTDIPEDMRSSVNAFNSRLINESKKFFINASFAAGYMHDDNVNIGPKSDTVEIAPISIIGTTLNTLEISDDSKPKESDGAFAQGSAQVTYDVGKRGGLTSQLRADYYQTSLENASENEVQYYGVSFALKSVKQQQMSLTAPVKWAHINYGGDDLVDIYGIEPQLKTALAGSKSLITRVNVQYNDYDSLDDRDSLYAELQEALNFRVEKAAASITAGITGFYEDADEDIYSNSGIEASIGAQKTIAAAVVSITGKYRGEWYEDKESIAPKKRSDDRFVLESSISYTFASRYVLDISYQHTDNNSTFDLYDYTRNIITAGVSGRF